MVRVLISGSSGFIGGHLANELRDRGHVVYGYDIKEGHDLLDKHNLHRVFEEFDPDEVYHLGGSVHMSPAEDDPERDIKLNYLGTLNVLNMCKKFGSPLLFTGSGASYGICGSPQKEDMLPRPMSNYGISKLAAELLIMKYVECHGVHATIIRYSSVYGPGRNAGPVNLMLKNAKEKGWIRVDGPGHHTRDLVDVRDAVNGTILIMEKGFPGELYNLGSGVETSIVEVAWIIHELTGAEIRHVPYKYSKFDLPRSRFDISKAQALGYEPWIPLKEGIEELMKHY
ncbi:GDP-6-deoxy-D-mannose reductase [subsurface metagenome]